MILVGQVPGLVKNVDIGILSDTIKVLNIKLCMIVRQIELYLFLHFSEFHIIFQVHSSVTVLTEHFMFLSN